MSDECPHELLRAKSLSTPGTTGYPMHFTCTNCGEKWIGDLEYETDEE